MFILTLAPFSKCKIFIKSKQITKTPDYPTDHPETLREQLSDNSLVPVPYLTEGVRIKKCSDGIGTLDT